ncbi:MAG: hypothetical protein WCD79_16050, partial [Chthoniobacteraceae bacterium]
MSNAESYIEKIQRLYGEVHSEVEILLDPKKQKRTFPIGTLETFLKSRKFKSLDKEITAEITALANSKAKRNLIPLEILQNFFEQDEVAGITPLNLKKAIEGNYD